MRLCLLLVSVGAVLAVGAVAAVTVFVAVLVAVAAVGFGAVEQEGHVVVFLGRVVFLDLAEHRALEQAGPHDEEGDVGERGHEVGVGNDLDGRAVEEDVVVFFAEFGQKLGQAGFGEEFGRVGRRGADGQDVEGFTAGLVDHERVPVVGLAAEPVGEAPFGLAGEDAQGALAQVKVEDDGLLALDREGVGEVGGDEGLAGADVEGGDHQDLAAGILAAHELEVGAHDAEGFVDDVAAVGLDDDLAVFGAVGDQVPFEEALLALGRGELAEEGGGEVLQVLTAAHGRVEDLLEVEPGEGDREAEQQGDEVDHLLVGGDGGAGAAGGSDDPGVVGGEGLRELILLTLLEEEEIQGFLDLLLALVAQELAGLQGNVADAGLGAALGLLRGGDLDVDGLDVVVQGGQDRAAQGGELLVEVLDEEVLFGTALDEAVALEHRGVELGDLGLGAGVFEADVGGQEGTRGGAADVALEEAGDGELVVEFHQVLAGFSAELHVHLGGGAAVGHAVGGAERGDGLVHAAELFLDDAEAVGDEFVGACGDLVLVLDPVLVVAVDDHPQDVFGPLGVDVAVVEVDDGRVLAVEGGAEAAAGSAGGALDAAAGHEDRAVPLGLFGVLGAGHEDAAEGRVGRVTVGGGDVGGLELVLAAGEVEEGDARRVFELQLEAGAFIAAEVEELHLDGQAGAVDGVLVTEALDLVVHVEMEVLGHLEHQVGGGEVDDLVVDVDAGLSEAEIGEGGGDVGGYRTGAAVFLDQDRGAAGVDGDGPDDVERGRGEADREAEDEPFPVADAEGPNVLEGEGVVFGLGVLAGEVGIVFHIVVVCYEGLLEPEDQEGDGGGEGGDRDPEGGAADVVAVDRGLAAALVVGGHVDDVALLDVEGGGGVEGLGVEEVELEDFVALGAVADEGDVFSLAVDREVTGEAEGVHQGEAVAVDLVAAGLGDFTEDGVGEVHILDGDDGVLDLAALDEELLDMVFGLLAREAGDLDLADHGEVDLAVGVDGVAADALAAGGDAGRADQGLILPEALGVVGEVEHCGDLRITAVDDDGNLVHRLEADGLDLGGGKVRPVVDVLEVGDARRGGAGGQEGGGEGCQDEVLEVFHRYGVLFIIFCRLSS